jgi:hypothetical protein
MTNTAATTTNTTTASDWIAARNEYVNANPYKGGSRTAYENKASKAIDAMMAARVR